MLNARALKTRAAQAPALRGVYVRVREKVRQTRRPGLIFVLGSQRSGTNALRRSLSLDPYVHGFNERKNSELYVGWSLRPEHEIRALLAALPNTVLLKPIQSVVRRPVRDFLEEFADYDVRTVWIYRDPVAVFRSRGERWTNLAAAAPFIKEWNRINSSALDALDDRMAVVCYDQLTSDEKVFHTLCTWLGIRGENLFHSGRSRSEVESALSEDEVAQIRADTGETLERLHAAAQQFLEDNATSAAVED